MIVTVGVVDCGEFLRNGTQPTMLYVRQRPKDEAAKYSSAQIGFGDVWYAATKSVDVQKDTAGYRELMDPEMSRTHHEEYVRVPLFPYVVNSRDLRLLYGFATQVGACAREALPPVKRVLQMHLALGDVYDQAAENKLEFYLGVAFRCLPLKG